VKTNIFAKSVVKMKKKQKNCFNPFPTIPYCKGCRLATTDDLDEVLQLYHEYNDSEPLAKVTISWSIRDALE
jgi:hypothetical protein